MYGKCFVKMIKMQIEFHGLLFLFILCFLGTANAISFGEMLSCNIVMKVTIKWMVTEQSHKM